MSEANVDLVRSALARFNREGIDGIADAIDPGFETTTPGSMALEPDTYRGAEGLRRWMDGWGDTMDEVRFEIDELIDAGDRVVAITRLVTRSATTGIELDQTVAMVWTLRGGRAVRMDPYATREEAVQAVGIPE